MAIFPCKPTVLMIGNHSSGKFLGHINRNLGLGHINTNSRFLFFFAKGRFFLVNKMSCGNPLDRFWKIFRVVSNRSKI